ncbi:MAG: hypothetical protein ACRD3J_19735, partial [Thermoanaerobaculia bacterium]
MLGFQKQVEAGVVEPRESREAECDRDNSARAQPERAAKARKKILSGFYCSMRQKEFLRLFLKPHSLCQCNI